jgi:guanylate kinase
MAQVPGLALSVSATTRWMRPGERDGTDYYFVSEDCFRLWVHEGRFLEWADYTGNLYGTPAQAVQESLGAGLDVVLEIELKGAKQVLAVRSDALMVFIMPPSLAELERRLRGRGTEGEEAVQSRLARAKEEMVEVEKIMGRDDHPRYYVIVNDTAERASKELASLIERTREEDEQAHH